MSVLSSLEKSKLQQVCRGCMCSLTPETTCSRDIDELRGLFQRFTDIEINDHDDLPRLFCKDCAVLLNTFHSFIEKAKNINQLLLTIVPQQRTLNSTKQQTNVCNENLSITTKDRNSKQAVHHLHEKKNCANNIVNLEICPKIVQSEVLKHFITHSENKKTNGEHEKTESENKKINRENKKTDGENKKTDGENEKTDGYWHTNDNVIWVSNDTLNQKINKMLHSEYSDLINQNINNNETSGSDDKIKQVNFVYLETDDGDLKIETERENFKTDDDSQKYVVKWLSDDDGVWFPVPTTQQHMRHDEIPQSNGKCIPDSKSKIDEKNINADVENNASNNSDNQYDEDWVIDNGSHQEGCLDFDNDVNMQCDPQVQDEEKLSNDSNIFKMCHKNAAKIRQTDQNVKTVENKQGDVDKQKTERKWLAKVVHKQSDGTRKIYYIFPRYNKIDKHPVKSSAGVENLQTEAEKISETEQLVGKRSNNPQLSISPDEQLQIASEQTRSSLQSLLQKKSYIKLPKKLLNEKFCPKYVRRQFRKSKSNCLSNIQPRQVIPCTEKELHENVQDTGIVLIDHTYTKVNAREKICNQCSILFYNSEYTAEQKIELISMIRKMDLVEDTQTYKYFCPQCRSRVNSEGQRMYICTKCPKGFVTKAKRYSHMHTHTNRERYYCTKCPRSYAAQESLRIHTLEKHTGDHCPYVCYICGKRYKWERPLRYHLRIHEAQKIRAHLCTLCGYNTYTAGLLKTHMIHAHSDETPFECDHCGYQCKTKNAIKKHVWRHYDDDDNTMKFQCQYCDKKIQTKAKLRYHEARHREPGSQCPACHKRFYDKPKLKRHLINKHKHLPDHFNKEICRATT